MDQILVDIPMCVYNHDKFIVNTIECILSQRTNFKYRLIIGEDFSTDNSREIVRRYAENFPDRILAIFHERNLGAFENSIILFSRCEAKYIALCDGDDYWTDPYKLQKQIDFLESNPDCTICFHNLNIQSDFSKNLQTMNPPDQKEISTLNDLLKGSNYIGTASCVFITKHFCLPSFYSSLPFGDYFLHLSNARYGKIRYINEVMGTYRVHEGGMHGSLFNDNLGKIKAYQQHYIFWTMLLKYESFDKIAVKKNIADSCDLVIQKALETKDFLVMTKYNIRLVYFGGVFRLWNFFRNYIRFIAYMFRPNS